MSQKPSTKAKQLKQKKRKLSDPSTPTSPPTPSSPYIGTIHEAPQYVKDNQHITGGYRINFNTPKKIFRTLFMAHNETVNIWTHLAGAIVVLCVVIYVIFFLSPYVMTSENKTQIVEFLDNSTIVRELTEGADHKLHDIRMELERIYDQLKNATKNGLEITDHTIHDLKEKLEGEIHDVLVGFVEAKEEFETKGVSGII